MAWTTADLLTNIKNRQMFPDASSGSLSSSALLSYATDELLITLLPLIMNLREGYYEAFSDTAYTVSTPSIALPNRSIGGVVSVVQFIANETISELEPLNSSQIRSTSTSPTPSHFYFQNNSIFTYPPPSTSYGTIRQRYFQRPSRLVQTSDCAQITAWDSGTLVATCTPVTAWTTANTVDFIPQNSSQATPYAIDTVVSAVSSTTMTFSSMSTADAALITVGDWISLAEYTPVPEIPIELQPVLAQATSVRALGAINDEKGLVNAKPDLQAYLEASVRLLTQRDQFGKKKVVSNWKSL